MIIVKHQNIVRFLGECKDTQGHATTIDGNFIMAEKRERLLCFEHTSSVVRTCLNNNIAKKYPH